MKLTEPSPEWVEKAMLLSKEDAEMIFSRMPKKITRKMDREKIDPLRAVARSGLAKRDW